MQESAVSKDDDVIVHWYRNIFSHVPSTKVREIAAMLKAIHASEDVMAAREKAIRVIEKLRALRLIESRRACGGGGRGDTDLLRLPGGALAAYSHQQSAGGVRAWWAHSRMVNRRSTSLPPGYGTSPGPLGLPRDI